MEKVELSIRSDDDSHFNLIKQTDKYKYLYTPAALAKLGFKKNLQKYFLQQEM